MCQSHFSQLLFLLKNFGHLRLSANVTWNSPSIRLMPALSSRAFWASCLRLSSRFSFSFCASFFSTCALISTASRAWRNKQTTTQAKGINKCSEVTFSMFSIPLWVYVSMPIIGIYVTSTIVEQHINHIPTDGPTRHKRERSENLNLFDRTWWVHQGTEIRSFRKRLSLSRQLLRLVSVILPRKQIWHGSNIHRMPLSSKSNHCGVVYPKNILRPSCWRSTLK